MYNVFSRLPVATKISTPSHHMFQFQKNVTERKIRVLSRSAKLSMNVLILKILAVYIMINIYRCKYTVTVFFQILMIAEFSRQIFENYFKNVSKKTLHCKQNRFVRTQRRTEEQTVIMILIIRFPYFLSDFNKHKLSRVIVENTPSTSV
jgi:hypothetical protein